MLSLRLPVVENLDLIRRVSLISTTAVARCWGNRSVSEGLDHRGKGTGRNTTEVAICHVTLAEEQLSVLTGDAENGEQFAELVEVGLLSGGESETEIAEDGTEESGAEGRVGALRMSLCLLDDGL